MVGKSKCEKCILYNRAHRNGITVPDLFTLLERQSYICPYTGMSVKNLDDAQVDHLVPRSRGGSNDLSNLQVVVEWINRLKHDMTDEEFRAKFGWLLVAARNLLLEEPEG